MIYAQNKNKKNWKASPGQKSFSDVEPPGRRVTRHGDSKLIQFNSIKNNNNNNFPLSHKGQFCGGHGGLVK